MVLPGTLMREYRTQCPAYMRCFPISTCISRKEDHRPICLGRRRNDTQDSRAGILPMERTGPDGPARLQGCFVTGPGAYASGTCFWMKTGGRTSPIRPVLCTAEDLFPLTRRQRNSPIVGITMHFPTTQNSFKKERASSHLPEIYLVSTTWRPRTRTRVACWY